MSELRIIAGLGNPGAQYEGSRHNLGFVLLDLLLRDCAEAGQNSSWKEKPGIRICEVTIEGVRALLVKPLRYMNRSGEPLQALMNFYKVGPEGLVVAHDDIDLPLGTMRLKSGGGDGGHNGVKSVVQSLATAEFVRIKLGVGRPLAGEASADIDVSDWVLARFRKEEESTAQHMLEQGAQAVRVLIAQGLKAAQNRYNISAA